MRRHFAIAELETGQTERFAVLAIYPTERQGAGCKAIIQSLHTTKDEAEDALTSAEMQICDQCLGAGGDNQHWTCSKCGGSGGVPA